MTTVNLTQHAATPDQQCVEPEGSEKLRIRELLTFDAVPGVKEMKMRAFELVSIALSHKADRAMIGGAPYFMAHLEAAFRNSGIEPVYAFSQRESVDQTLPDGSVVKKTVFKHAGFVTTGIC